MVYLLVTGMDADTVFDASTPPVFGVEGSARGPWVR
jgi:hypothetical protein